MLITTRQRSALILFCLLLLAPLASEAVAQSSLGIGTAEPSFSGSGVFGSFLDWVNSKQQAFYRALSGAIKAMRDDPSKLWGLVSLSFAYGVFHAAGPGHGKAIISSYVIANEQTLRRGIAISFLAAFMQGFVAVVIVGVTYFALRGTGISMTGATHTLEIASYGLIAGFGAWLLFRKLRPILRPTEHKVDHEHNHTHHHNSHEHGHDHGSHQHDADSICQTCGHSHAPDPSTLMAEHIRLREAWSAIVAIGLRPCSGALIVLTFALLNGLYLGGLLSVTAMSIGTAITVSLLATLAVLAKKTAMRLATSQSAATRIGNIIEIAGAALVLILGLVLLFAALQA